MSFLKPSILAISVLVWMLVASLGVFLLASTGNVLHERGQALRLAHEEARTAVHNNLEPAG